MSVSDSAGSRTDSVVVLSPQQFHDRVVTALRAAIAARAGEPGGAAGDDDGTRALADLLQEVPVLGPEVPGPPLATVVLVEGVRWLIDNRSAEAAAGSEQLLDDLLGFVLAFYPEAVPPPL